MSDPLPRRPRLSARISARRHVTDAERRILLIERRSQRFVVVGEREWELICCADGSRDLPGVQIAAARRGRSVTADELEAFFGQLAHLDFLVEGDEPDEEAEDAPAITEGELEASRASFADRRLDPFPDSPLSCDGRGACCTMFQTVIFSPREARRALALRTEAREPALDERALFTPERGASFEPWGPAHGALAVSLRRGRCAFLEESALCGLHRRGGPEWKPAGCALYPLRFVDDGEAIRVTPAPECACVFDSFASGVGAPLLPPSSSHGADLPRAAHVEVLPEMIPITESIARRREELLPWTRSLLDELRTEGEGDLAAALLRLSRELEEGERAPALDERGTAPWRREAITDDVRALGDRAARWTELSASWCAPDARALQATLAVTKGCAELLSADEPPRASNAARRDENLYGLTLFHGHLWHEASSLASALRARAIRLLLARTEALGAAFDEEEHPLAMVESTLRSLEAS